MTLKFHGHNLKVPMRNPIFRVKGRGRFRLAMGRCFQTAIGSLRWMVTVRPRYPKHTLVVVRLQPANDGINCFSHLKANWVSPLVTAHLSLCRQLLLLVRLFEAASAFVQGVASYAYQFSTVGAPYSRRVSGLLIYICHTVSSG